jgi:hypothetical protein
MTVERNRNIADKVMVVGNIDNCHLSKKVLEKSNTEYIDINRLQEIQLRLRCRFLHRIRKI